MPEELDDLWPDLNASAVVTPAAILKTQATVLHQKSKGLLSGEVTTWSDNGLIYHRLAVVVPSLENYRYNLLSICHEPTLYPVYARYQGSVAIELSSEADFREWLRETLRLSETRRILESLMAQAAA